VKRRNDEVYISRDSSDSKFIAVEVASKCMDPNRKWGPFPGRKTLDLGPENTAQLVLNKHPLSSFLTTNMCPYARI
jgi:hypothetical protein